MTKLLEREIVASVSAIESTLREGTASIPDLGADRSARLRDADWPQVCGLLDQFGGPFLVQALRVLFGRWTDFAARYALADDGSARATIQRICAAANPMFLEIAVEAGLSVQPREVEVDLERCGAVERAYRESLPSVWGTTRIWRGAWTAEHQRIASAFVDAVGEAQAVNAVKVGCTYWWRLRRLTPCASQYPSLHALYEHGQGWGLCSEPGDGPPPIAKLADVPVLPLGACGHLEGAWRVALAAVYPRLAMELVNAAWTARQKQILDDLVADWGAPLVGYAITPFFNVWRRVGAAQPFWAAPSHEAFEFFAGRWCPEMAWRLRDLDGARRVSTQDLRRREARLVAELTAWLDLNGGCLDRAG